MCIFNDLLLNGVYPSIRVKFKNGKYRVIRYVQFIRVIDSQYVVDKCNLVVITLHKETPKEYELKNIDYVSIINE